MGRSQSVIFGYGAVIPTFKFVSIFPKTFKYDKNDNIWIANYKNINALFRDTSIRIYYSEGEDTDTIFLTSVYGSDFGFEKGYIYQKVVPVNLLSITETHEGIENWIQSIFPDANTGYFMYGYYT